MAHYALVAQRAVAILRADEQRRNYACKHRCEEYIYKAAAVARPVGGVVHIIRIVNKRQRAVRLQWLARVMPMMSLYMPAALCFFSISTACSASPRQSNTSAIMPCMVLSFISGSVFCAMSSRLCRSSSIAEKHWLIPAFYSQGAV